MRFIELPLTSFEIKKGLIRFSTPLIIEPKEVKFLAQDFFHLFKRNIFPKARGLGEGRKEANADTFPIYLTDQESAFLNFVYDIDSTRLSFETKRESLLEPLFRLLREQRVIKPDLEYIRERVSGSLPEISAALLWQIGAIKTSLGDLKPFFKVDERKNRSPIYIDLKCLPNYPRVFDFLIAQAALILAHYNFDLICGIEAGSISFASLLAQKVSKPSFFARRERRYKEAPLLEGIKEHELFRKRVLLVDDTIVKGWTKRRAIEEIRAKGGICEYTFVLFDRCQGGKEELAALNCQLLSLTNRDALLSRRIPRTITLLTEKEYKEILSYFSDPKGWHKKKGFPYYELKPK
jgi:orotate phosphoribosyltransferase|uniref:Phosphoribosyltransferase domain-containing protein n=1 Tax=candidate division WOR-3 bacterium TaxID=2052148 RepID=A0A7C3Z2J9_UNCW3